MKQRSCWCFMGAPGVGKGTQAAMISKNMNFKHISTGNILREAVKNQTSLGLKARSYMSEGQLVPDHLMIDLIQDVLNREDMKNQNFILDGFPRTLPQAEALEQLFQKLSIQLVQILLFTLKEEELIKRATGRRLAPQSGRVYHIDFSPPKRPGVCDITGEKLIQREDDKEAVVRKRLKTSSLELCPLIDYYKSKGLVQEVLAEGVPESIYKKVLDLLNKKRLAT